MNYMGEIAALLGVELGEKFEYNGATYILDELGMIQVNNGSCNLYNDKALVGLLTGAHKIDHKPFKPNYEQKYFIVDNDGYIIEEEWLDTYVDACNYKLGNCYRTYQEAERNRNKWLSFYSSDKILEV